MTPKPTREVSTVYLTVAAVFTAAALAGGLYAWHTTRCMRRALTRERAAHRLTDAALERDMREFRRRINATLVEARVLAVADRIVDDELARTIRHNPQEGDTPC